MLLSQVVNVIIGTAGVVCKQFTTIMYQELGPDRLCWHNFEHNRQLKELRIMLA